MGVSALLHVWGPATPFHRANVLRSAIKNLTGAGLTAVMASTELAQPLLQLVSLTLNLSPISVPKHPKNKKERKLKKQTAPEDVSKLTKK